MTGRLLSVIIPCYNEAASLPELVERLAEVFGPLADRVEVVLVDNGSTDSSAAIMAEAVAKHDFIRSVRVEVNQGYGHGILRGLESAGGRYLGWTHADLQTDPADILPILDFLERSGRPPVFCKGRRYGRPAADVFFTMGMSCFESLIFARPLWDINAQPTIFPKEFFETWAEPPADFSLDLYAYVTARRQGLTIRRFPVRFGRRAHGQSHWNVNWRAKLKFIRRTWSYSWALRGRGDTV